MNKSSSRLDQLKRFFLHDAWTTELSSMSGWHRLIVRFVRVGQLVIRGFREDDLAVHAAALTFATLVSLVPLLTIGFGWWLLDESISLAQMAGAGLVLAGILIVSRR